MGNAQRTFIWPICAAVLSSMILLGGAAIADDGIGLTGFYDRLARDLKSGKPMVVTVYVALCDNDSQGIVPVRNRSICNGDDPSQNMYWATKGGLRGFAKGTGWKKVSHQVVGNAVVLEKRIWKKRMRPGGELGDRGITESFDVYLVGIAYRGSQIHHAMKDYLAAVNGDLIEPIDFGDDGHVAAGGGSHLVGYIGHDYFMDVMGDLYDDLMEENKQNGTLSKGVFALACVGNEFIRPAITRDNVYILALNNFLTYPSAWTIGGIVEGVSHGLPPKKIHRRLARAFASAQKTGMKWALKAFSYGAEPGSNRGRD